MSLKTKEFENKFSEFTGSKYSAMVNSGSSADLLMANLMHNYSTIRKGDQILVPCITLANTYLVYFSSRIYSKIEVDIDKETLNIDYNDLEKKLQKKLKPFS